MADAPHAVLDLSGRLLGTTDDPEGVFLEHLRGVVHTTPAVYVVLGPGGSDEFADACRELCPVVEDDRIGDRAIIVDGSPLEWEAVAKGAEWSG